MLTDKSHINHILSQFVSLNRDTAGVQEDVRNDKNAAAVQPLLSSWGCRTVGCFGQNLAIDAIAILESNLVLERCRDQNVTRDIPNRVWTWKRFGTRKVPDRAGVFSEFVQFLDRQSLRVV